MDEGLLAGDHGHAAAKAMQILVRCGQALEAERFISIASAHFDGSLFHGQSSIDFVRRFVELKGKVIHHVLRCHPRLAEAADALKHDGSRATSVRSRGCGN